MRHGHIAHADLTKGEMMKTTKLIPVLVAAFLAAPVFAQSLPVATQRDVNQQQRIEKGLQSGQLNTREAAKLERDEAKISRVEGKAMADGKVTAAERARIDNMQDHASHDIYKEKHDAQTGNPASASSQRMQADVQRNINQKERIQAGTKDGSLTAREAARLERGQARTERREARAGINGRVGAGEQARIQRGENRQSEVIRHERHNLRRRG
jgi:hypothetical protein